MMAALTAVTSGAQVSDDNARRFEVRDSVEMSYFGVLPTAHPEDLDDDGIESPDGRYLVKVTHRGVLPEGYTEGTVWLFDAKAIRRSMSNPAPRPRPGNRHDFNGLLAALRASHPLRELFEGQ